MYSSVDEYGYKHLEVQDITRHHRNDDAVHADESHVKDKSGRRHRRITTKGWDFRINWQDGTTSWIPLSDMKEAVPVQIAEYAIANKIEKEPAFAWWVPYTIKKKSQIISAVNKRVRFTSQKYGFKIPRSKAEAIRFDEENGNRLWQDAIEK